MSFIIWTISVTDEFKLNCSMNCSMSIIELFNDRPQNLYEVSDQTTEAVVLIAILLVR